MKHTRLPLFLIIIIFSAFHFGCKKEKIEEPRFFSPDNVKATSYSDSTIKVSWADNSNVEDVFEIHRKIGDEAFKLVKTNVANDTVFIDRDVSPNKKYTYRVRAKNKNSETTFSDEVSVTLSLPTPVLQALAVNDATIRLTWTDNSVLESGFVLERATGSLPFVVLAKLEKNIKTYDDGTAQVNQEYKYRIKAINKTTETDYSNSTSTQIKFNAPALTLAFPGGNTVKLMWTDNSNFESGYVVEQSVNDGAYKEIAKIDSTNRDYNVENLETSKRYIFKVKAYSDKNTSAYSNTKRTYYAEKRYVVTETYSTQAALDGQITMSPSTNLLASSGYYSKNIVLINRVTRSVSTITTGHTEGTYAVKFSTDNKYLLVTSAMNGSVEIWDVASRTLFKKVGTGMEAAFCLSFNPAGNMLAVGGTGGSKIVVYDFPAMTVKYTLTTDNHNVRDLLFYNNDTKLISCANNDKIQFWNLSTSSLEKTIGNTPGHIGTIDINTSSSLLTSSSYDGTTDQLKIWSIAGNALAAVTMKSGVSSTHWGADDFVYCTDYDGKLSVIDKNGSIVEVTSLGSSIYFADINRNAKLISVLCKDQNAYVLSNVPVWTEY
jgi:WD40 repeat protein